MRRSCTRHDAPSRQRHALLWQLFLDNERANCLDVASLGVTVAFVPYGVTGEAWRRALEAFPAPGEVLDNRQGL